MRTLRRLIYLELKKHAPLIFHSLGNLREQIPRRHAASKKKLKTNKWKKKLRFSTSLIRQLIVPALNFSLLWRFPVGEHCHKNSWNWRSNMTNVLGHEFCFLWVKPISSKAATGYWTVLCGYLCISPVVEWTFEVTKYMFKFCIPDGGCYNYWEIFLSWNRVYFRYHRTSSA